MKTICQRLLLILRDYSFDEEGALGIYIPLSLHTAKAIQQALYNEAGIADVYLKACYWFYHNSPLGEQEFSELIVLPYSLTGLTYPQQVYFNEVVVPRLKPNCPVTFLINN